MNELIKEAFNKRLNKKLVYNDKWHTYTMEDGKKLTSSTRFIKQFFKPFDSEYWSKYVAKRDGLTQKEVLAMWKKKGDLASEYGTEVHEYGEALFQKLPPRRTRLQRAIVVRPHVKKVIECLLETWEPIGIEKIVFNEKIAGTMDFLLKHKVDKNRYLIGDWKTNEEIPKDNKYNNFGLYPIKHIPDTKLYHYALQLSLYKYILLKEDYVEEGSKVELGLYHIQPAFVEKLDIPYLEKEIESMINKTV